MKRIKRLVLALAVGFPFLGLAQPNNIGFNLLGTTYGDYSLSYERKINEGTSIRANLGYWNLNSFVLDIESMFDTDGGIGLTALEQGFHSAVEYRFYVGNTDAIKGFYLAPYARYWHFNAILNDYIGGTYFDIDSRLTSFGLGFQMGYQWVIKDRFTIDWYFFGVGAERFRLNGFYETASSGFNYNSIRDDVLEVFEGFGIIEKNVVATPNSDNLHVVIPILGPGIKTGLSLGFAF